MTNSSYGNFDYELCVKILNLLKVNIRNILGLSFICLPLSLWCQNGLFEIKTLVYLMFVFPRGHFQLV